MSVPRNEGPTKNKIISESVDGNAILAVVYTNNKSDDLKKPGQPGLILRGDRDDPSPSTRCMIHEPDYSSWGHDGWCRPSLIAISVILILIALAISLSLLHHATDKDIPDSAHTGDDFSVVCMDKCKLSLVETIPPGLVYADNSISHAHTYEIWMKLISSAQSSIEITNFYWNLRGEHLSPSEDVSEQGQNVFAALLEAGRDRGVRLRIAENILSKRLPSNDTEDLSREANAQVRRFNYSSPLGAGVSHTKMMLIDRTHVYVGSANMNWHTFTRYKELGILAVNCSCLANDVAKIFDAFWKLSEEGKIPTTWPNSLTTKINAQNPMSLTTDDDVEYRTFVASSPPQFSPRGRTNDLDAILHCFDRAEKFIFISVTDYAPLLTYLPVVKYWPILDDALRSAAIDRRVHIRLLIAWWEQARRSRGHFLKSLAALDGSYENIRIEVKLFILPRTSKSDTGRSKRTNHAKYIVTDVGAYMGTSDWTGDYFHYSTGIGMVFEDVEHNNKKSIRQQLADLFLRDWNSKYAYPLKEIYADTVQNKYCDACAQRHIPNK